MISEFGSETRALEKQQKLFQRQVAPFLNMGTAQLGIIGKDLIQLKKDQIIKIVDILNNNKNEIKLLWHADHIIDVIKGSTAAFEALNVTGNQIQKNLKKQANELPGN